MVCFAAVEGRILFSSNESVIFIILGGSIVWPLGYFAVSRCKFMPQATTMQAIAIATFSAFALFSAAFSPETIKSTVYAVMTILAICICLQFHTNLDIAGYEKGLGIYSIPTSAFLLWETYVNYIGGGYASGRLTFVDAALNPNAIALISMSVLLSSMMLRSLVWRWSIFSAALIPLLMTRSRASAIGAIIGLVIVFIVRTKAATGKTKIMVLLLVALVITGGAIFSETVTGAGSEFFSLHDRHRGIDSGATGRIHVWKEVWGLFLDNPILGVGFRAHEGLLKAGSSSHQGYLALLAEVGIFGFMAVMYLVSSGILTLWGAVKRSDLVYSHSVPFGLAIGYLFIGMFERYMINVGNPTSLLFLLAITIPKVSPTPGRFPSLTVGNDSVTVGEILENTSVPCTHRERYITYEATP